MKIKALGLMIVPFILLSWFSGARAATLEIVGFGDSLMAGYELPAEEAFPQRLEPLLKAAGHDVTITNAGVSGDTTADGLARIDWSVQDGVDGVILELGANDALRGLSPAQTRDNLDQMIAKLKERKIGVLLVGMLAPPNMGQDYQDQFNAIFPELAAKHQVPLYPFFLDGVMLNPDLQLKDGMHPNGKGTQVMAEKFLPAAEAFLRSLTPAQ